MPLKALVRIRIPLKRPALPENPDATAEEEPGDNEAAEEGSQGKPQQKEQESAPATARTDQYEEQEIEDKVLLVTPVADDARVLVFH